MEFEKIKEIITSVIQVEPTMIVPEASFIDDLGADSLDLFQIITSVEDEFQIIVNDSGLGKIRTVGDAVMQIKNAGRSK